MEDPLSVARQFHQEGKFEEALAHCLPAAQQGDARCQRFLGWMYATGCGVAKDEAEALQWYSAAANNSSARALELMGRDFYRTEQYSDAMSWFAKAASQGNMTALWRIGRMYRDGEGVDVDTNRAYSIFHKASQNGHLFATRDRAFLQMQGHRGAGQILSGLILFFRSAIDLIHIAWKDEGDERLRH